MKKIALMLPFMVFLKSSWATHPCLDLVRGCAHYGSACQSTAEEWKTAISGLSGNERRRLRETRTGHACLFWDDISFSEFHEQNFCGPADDDLSTLSPWCYTSNPLVVMRWEYCLPDCKDLPRLPTTTLPPCQPSSSTTAAATASSTASTTATEVPNVPL